MWWCEFVLEARGGCGPCRMEGLAGNFPGRSSAPLAELELEGGVGNVQAVILLGHSEVGDIVPLFLISSDPSD